MAAPRKIIRPIFGKFAETLQGVTDAAAARVNLGLVIGTDVQAYDADLTAIAALTTTSYGRAFLALTNAAAARTAAGVVIGTDVQAYDADLAAIAAISTTAYGRAFLALADAAAARTALALGTAAVAASGDFDAAGAAAAVLAKFKAQRVTTGSINGAATALVTVTWAVAFGDANYTVQASVEEATASSLALSVVHIETISASAVAVRILNNAVGALTGILHVTALHD